MAGDLRTNRNELIKLFVETWPAIHLTPVNPALPAGPYKYVLAFNDANAQPDNAQRAPWARLTLQHTESNSRGINTRRLEHRGTMVVQCFVHRPNDKSPADNQVQILANAVVLALTLHRGNVQLRDIGPIDRPINEGFAQCDVRAAFLWDQFVKTGA